MKDVVASWRRRKDCKVSLYDTRYGTKGRIVCNNKRNATGLVCGSLTGFECFKPLNLLIRTYQVPVLLICPLALPRV